jgi:hypothetical protein
MGERSRLRGAAKAKRRAETPKTRFARLDHDLLKSSAYSALSPASRSLLNEFAMMLNDKNNGHLWLSVDDAAARMGVADPRAAMAALDQLQELGFVAMTRDAHFRVKVGKASARARCWRVTWEPVRGLCGPTFDYRGAEPPAGSPVASERLARKRMIARQKALKAYGYALPEQKSSVEDSSTLIPPSPLVGVYPVEDYSTAFSNDGGKAGKMLGEESSTHTASTMGPGETAAQAGCTGYNPWWVNEALPALDDWARRMQAEIANDRTCERHGCGNKVVAKRAGNTIPKRFCSEACRKSAERARAYQREREAA